MIENGRITSVVIIDRAGDGYQGPDSHKDVDVDMTDDNKINIRFYGAANEPDEDEAIELIEAYFEDQGYTATKKTAGKDPSGYATYTWTLENAKGYELGTYTFKYHSNYILQEHLVKLQTVNDDIYSVSKTAVYLINGESVNVRLSGGDWSATTVTATATEGTPSVNNQTPVPGSSDVTVDVSVTGMTKDTVVTLGY